MKFNHRMTEYMKKSFVAFAVLFSLTVTSTNLHGHNVYSSFTAIEWNSVDNSLEVIMQIHGHELEAKLSIDAGKRLSFLDNDDYPELEKATQQYVMQNLSLQVDDIPAELNYIGMETNGQIITVYLETVLPKAPSSMKIMNSILLDALPGQTNSVIATINGKRLGGDNTQTSGPITLTFK